VQRMIDSAIHKRGPSRWLARGLISALLLLGVFYFVPSDQLLQALSKVSLRDIVILLLLSWALIAVSVLKWRLFLRQLGISPAFKTLFSLYLVGYFVNVFTPSFIGGDVVRSIALGQHGNRAHAVSATALERYTGIVAMLVMALCACCVSTVVTKEIVLVVIAAMLGLVWATWVVFSGAINKIAKKVALPTKILKVADAIHEGLVWGVRDRGLLRKAFVLSIVFHLLTIVNTAAVGAAVGWVEIPWTGLLVVVPLILLVGAVPISPQGLGIQEGAFVFFLHSVGATTGEALAIALVLRAKSYLLALLGGLIWIMNKPNGGSCGSQKKGTSD
jgi:uncharacterized protein (TIRG00374 family)